MEEEKKKNQYSDIGGVVHNMRERKGWSSNITMERAHRKKQSDNLITWSPRIQPQTYKYRGS
jgi:hypothetical protein